MQFRRRTSKFDGEGSILPLINVVFLLLIFFMLVGRLTQAAPFTVTPPVSQQAEAAEPPAAEAPREAAILIAADGRLALNGRLLEPLALKTELAAQLAAQPDLPVTLRADGAAEATEVVAVMETLRDAGVRHLQLFAQASPSAPGTAEP
ncbi:MAG TPA: biopolymer transporter ExbD [Kiloniellaceae bacterium]